MLCSSNTKKTDWRFADFYSVALIVQVHLHQNRPDLAAKDAAAARRWAQDSLLVNLAESWIGLRQGGDKYQAAFYVFEELAQAPASHNALSLVCQAVTELHLGRLPEARTALEQAEAMESESSGPRARAEVLANRLVLDALLGEDSAPARAKLEKEFPQHRLLRDIADKQREFREAAARY
jgi:coatomer protein complex subunit epsilon